MSIKIFSSNFSDTPCYYYLRFQTSSLAKLAAKIFKIAKTRHIENEKLSEIKLGVQYQQQQQQ
jgi:hypothetical protein